LPTIRATTSQDAASPPANVAPVRALWIAFIACLAVRGACVYFNGPLEHLFSDPYRHWENGARFLAPRIMGSIDPFAYQLWLRVLQWLDRGTHIVVLGGTAALSMALPFCWYKALRELLPAAWALAGATVIGFMPSLVVIYSYFMNETLLLTLCACGFWLALRAMRTASVPTLWALALVWAGASYTRLAAVPLAAMCVVAVALVLPWRLRAVLAAAIGIGFGVLAIPACWHSSLNLNFCAPFGADYLNNAYRVSGARAITLRVPLQREITFISPAMFDEPLAPMSDWESKRRGTRLITIDPARGRADWEMALSEIRDAGSQLSWWDDKAENALMLFFDPSWPEWDRADAWWRLSLWNRWLWFPLALTVALALARVRPPPREALLPLAGLALLALLLVQTTGVMEGRYRKPAEPLLIAGAVVLLHRLWGARRRTRDSSA